MKKTDLNSLPPEMRNICETVETLGETLEKISFLAMAQQSVINALMKNAPPEVALDAARALEENATLTKMPEQKDFILEYAQQYKNISANPQ